MSRYFLDLISGGVSYVDSEGVECASAGDAILEARRIFGEVLRDGTPTSDFAEIGPLAIVVRTQGGASVTLDLTLSLRENRDEFNRFSLAR